MTYATKEWIAGAVLVALFAGELLVLAAPPVHAAVSDWQQGSSILPRWSTDFGSDSFKQSLDNLKKTGANSVALIVPYYQSNTQSSDIRAGSNTPTPESLAAGIDYAHAIGLAVNLKLHVESMDGTWRAYIRPINRASWYMAYNSVLMNLAQVAQSHHVELITIGTELVSTAASSENPENTMRWVQMIQNVRGIYSGKLTYGANSNDNGTNPFINEKRYIGFWPYLDYVGISAYYQLNADGSVQGLKSAWDWWNNNDIKAFAQSTGKQILFTEVGYRSIDGSYQAPWDWGRGGAVNEQVQANAYEALMSYWNDYGYIAGVYWWDWSSDPNAGGPGSGDFTPQRKLAEKTMTTWFTNAPTPPPGGGGSSAPAFSSQGSSNPSGTTLGNSLAINAAVTNVGNPLQHMLVDVEVYNEANQKVHQQFFEDQAFSAGETRNFSVNWTPQATGSYRIAIGVFSSGWGTNYHWNSTAGSVQVSGSSNPPPPPPPQGTTTPPSNPPPATATVRVWWPTDGTHVSGVQPVKAVVDGREVSTYEMFWKVDDGQEVAMQTSTQDAPHKEALIDYSGWSWKGSGPYKLTFVARAGSVIGQTSVNVYIP